MSTLLYSARLHVVVAIVMSSILTAAPQITHQTQNEPNMIAASLAMLALAARSQALVAGKDEYPDSWYVSLSSKSFYTPAYLCPIAASDSQPTADQEEKSCN